MPDRGLPPGPRLPALVQGVGTWTRPLPWTEKLGRRYGRRFTIRFPGSPAFVMLSDPDDLKQVFTAPTDVLHPGEGAKVLEPIVGRNSVLLLDEDAHMSQRKLMLPAFHGEKMAALSDLMREVADSEVARWAPGETEVHPSMQRLTLEIILRAAFGLDPGPRLDALRDLLGRELEFGDRPISLVPLKQGSIGYRLAQRFGPLGELQRIQAESDRLIFDLIEERRADPGDRDDVLAMLLEARHEDGEPMSDQELRDELMTLLVAGHETTASSLAWAFTVLPHEPRVLERLTEEIEAGDGEDYTVAVIREILRMRPVLPNVQPRLVKKPVEIGGYTYPPGVCLVGNAYLLHHDPEFYPEPHTFRPERFLERAPGTYTWIPFGGGRRRCLGASFAKQEMGHVLRAVLGRWTVEPASGGPEPARRRNITIRPAEGARVRLAARAPAVAAAA